MDRSDYKEQKNCEICGKEFSITRIRHKCKRCNLIICADCTKGNAVIIGYTDMSPHKVCKYCNNELEAQKTFKNENNTNWNSISKIGDKWLRLPHVSKFMASFEHDFNYYLQSAESSSQCTVYLKDIERDLQSGRFDKEYFNFSTLEFLHYSQLNKPKDAIRKNVANVIKAFLGKNPHIGYHSGMGNLANFLLCVLDERNSFWVMAYIIERLLPSGFYGQDGALIYGCLKENYILLKTALNFMVDIRSDVNKVQVLTLFFERIVPFILQTFLFDTMNFDALMFTWNKILETNSYIELEKTVLAMINQSNSRTLIFNNHKELTLIKYQQGICRFISKKYLVENANKAEVDEKLRLALEEEFLTQEFANQLNKQAAYLASFEKISKLTVNEIMVLREEFERFIAEKRAANKVKAKPGEPYIFNKIEFIIVFDNFTKKILNGGKRFTKEDPETFFDILDSTKSNKISSKQIYTTLTLVLHISTFDKITMIFKIFDSSQKQVLNKTEAKELVESLFEAAMVMSRLKPDPYFVKDVVQFKTKSSKKVKKMDKVKMADVNLDHLMKVLEKYFDFARNVGDLAQDVEKAKSFQRSSSTNIEHLSVSRAITDETQATINDASLLSSNVPGEGFMSESFLTDHVNKFVTSNSELDTQIVIKEQDLKTTTNISEEVKVLEQEIKILDQQMNQYDKKILENSHSGLIDQQIKTEEPSSYTSGKAILEPKLSDPNGHILHRAINFQEGDSYFCDVCRSQKEFSAEPPLHCSECQYYVCKNCELKVTSSLSPQERDSISPIAIQIGKHVDSNFASPLSPDVISLKEFSLEIKEASYLKTNEVALLGQHASENSNKSVQLGVKVHQNPLAAAAAKIDSTANKDHHHHQQQLEKIQALFAHVSPAQTMPQERSNHLNHAKTLKRIETAIITEVKSEVIQKGNVEEVIIETKTVVVEETVSSNGNSRGNPVPPSHRQETVVSSQQSDVRVSFDQTSAGQPHHVETVQVQQVAPAQTQSVQQPVQNQSVDLSRSESEFMSPVTIKATISVKDTKENIQDKKLLQKQTAEKSDNCKVCTIF